MKIRTTTKIQNLSQPDTILRLGLPAFVGLLMVVVAVFERPKVSNSRFMLRAGALDPASKPKLFVEKPKYF